LQFFRRFLKIAVKPLYFRFKRRFFRWYVFTSEGRNALKTALKCEIERIMIFSPIARGVTAQGSRAVCRLFAL